MLVALVSACTGLFDGIYDSPDKAPKITSIFGALSYRSPSVAGVVQRG